MHVHRQFTQTTPRVSRYGSGTNGGGFGSGLRRMADKNMQTKKAYVQAEQQLRPSRHLWRAFGFFVGTGVVSFTCASIVEYQNINRKLRALIDDTIGYVKRIYFGDPAAGNQQMDRALVYLICANIMVFVAWRLAFIQNGAFAALQPLMIRYFTASFASKSLCLPMLFSVFSHNHWLHLTLNMYVLHSFGIPTVGLLGREQFLAFYLTGGVFASLVSLLEKAATRSMLPSLGASGAIAASIGYICMMVPDSYINIIFLPQWKFTAQNAIYGFVVFETLCLLVGVFTRFKLFDNAAHLGGVLFGVWYAKYGEEFYRRSLMPTVVHCWQRMGFDQRGGHQQQPVIVYDGKKHVQTTLDKLASGEFEQAKQQSRQPRPSTKADEQQLQREKRRLEWEEYRAMQLAKQRQRKQQILERRKQQQLAQEQPHQQWRSRDDQHKDEDE